LYLSNFRKGVYDGYSRGLSRGFSKMGEKISTNYG
jgi:hypothetical protein